MNDQLRKVVEGAGSYVAVIVMVWFAMKDAPAWLVLFAGIGNGVLFAYVLGFIIPFCVNGTKLMLMLYDAMTYSKTTLDNEMVELYAAYIYDYTKRMSDLQKRVD